MILGGTAGSVVAKRLDKNPNANILVIEAGVSNHNDNEAFTTTARAFDLRGSKLGWSYETTMIERLD